MDKCGPFESHDAGYYDPRGCGADYETMVCTKCGKTEDFRIGYRDDFYERFEEQTKVMSSKCVSPVLTEGYYKKKLIEMFDPDKEAKDRYG